MKFPILIHLLNNKARHIVMTWEELPMEHYFKIVRTGINPLDTGTEIEVDYKVKVDPVSEELEVDQSPQENHEPPVADSTDNGASGSGTDSDGASL
jgi:hypothetical protein